eukprot:2996123-Rhodomonas_salina.7
MSMLPAHAASLPLDFPRPRPHATRSYVSLRLMVRAWARSDSNPNSKKRKGDDPRFPPTLVLSIACAVSNRASSRCSGCGPGSCISRWLRVWD